jgi:hypothetical protein
MANMGWQTIHLSREELFKKVWERPVLEVAAELGVSGVALGKTCRRMGVPVPGRGYWARRAAGEELRMPSLPEPHARDLRVYSVRRWVDPLSGVPSTSERTTTKPAAIVVPDELVDPHSLVKASLPLLRQAKELRDGLLTRESCLSITVETHAQMGRAIRIMDTLLKALEGRGWAVKITPPERGQPDSYGRVEVKPSNTVVTMAHASIAFGIDEGSDRVATTPKGRRGIFDTYERSPEYKAVPNGRLSLRIYSYVWFKAGVTRQNWTDGARQRLEDCLGSFVSTLALIDERTRVEEIARERESAEREKQWQEEAERQRLRALELARVRDLNGRLGDYSKARRIHDLAGAVERDARDRGEALTPGSPLAEWLEWARARASRLERRAIAGRGSASES